MYLQSSYISGDVNIFESNGNNFQFDRDSQRWPIEHDLSICHDSSNGIDRLSISNVFGQPVFVVEDGKAKAIRK